MNKPYEIGVSLLIFLVFAFLVYAFVIRKQNVKINWAIFYSLLYIASSLPLVNLICIEYGLWKFNEPFDNKLNLPVELYFLWTVMWSVIPIYFLKGKFLLPLAIVILWIDILLMPLLQTYGVLELNENWLIGEIALILFVFIPGYLWAYCSLSEKFVWLRAVFQMIVMVAIFIFGIPLLMQTYGLITEVQLELSPYLFQFFLILTFPGIVATYDLVAKGKGTPFPYDATKHLVRSGVYAYIKNPIQWSFTLMFIPISLYYDSWYFMLGSLISIAYSIGISDVQEYADMKKRFGKEWEVYKKQVPKWRFLWKPVNILSAEIYFDDDCKQCCEIKKWFLARNTVHLDIKSKIDFKRDEIIQVTYVDEKGREYKSVYAIACALEHINLAYATLGWFMRMPGVNFLLQSIIDSMNIGNTEHNCELH